MRKFLRFRALVTMMPYWSMPSFAWDSTVYSLWWLPLAKKPQLRANFDIWGDSCTDSLLLTDEGQIWCARANPRSTLTCQISSWSVYFVALWWLKDPKFYHFIDLNSILWCRQLAAIWESWTRVHNYKTFPYPMVSRSFLYSIAFMAKSCAQTDVQKRDEQTKN